MQHVTECHVEPLEGNAGRTTSTRPGSIRSRSPGWGCSYDPDAIVVKAGTPVRLNFTRRESSICSEMVVFDGIDHSAKLPEGETVPVEFTPDTPGEIPFQCQMDMLRGKVVVTK